MGGSESVSEAVAPMEKLKDGCVSVGGIGWWWQMYVVMHIIKDRTQII